MVENLSEKKKKKKDDQVVVGEKRLRLEYKNVIFGKTASVEEDEKKEGEKTPKEEEKTLNEEEEKKEEEKSLKEEEEDREKDMLGEAFEMDEMTNWRIRMLRILRIKTRRMRWGWVTRRRWGWTSGRTSERSG